MEITIFGKDSMGQTIGKNFAEGWQQRSILWLKRYRSATRQHRSYGRTLSSTGGPCQAVPS